MTTRNQHTKIFMLVSLALLGCGESDVETKKPSSNTSQTMKNQFEPDPVLLDSTAITSRDLHVKPEFTFKTSSVVKLDLSGRDVFGSSLAAKSVKVYATEKIVAHTDEQANFKKSLLATTRFDSSGQLGLKLDIPTHYQTLLIRVDGMLENNYLLVPIKENTDISHQFY